MPKVIHLIPHDGIGGVEAAARSMANADFLSCEFNLLLIAGKTLAKNPQRVIETSFQSANNPLAHCLALFRVLRRKPEVLICSLWRSMLIGLLVKILRPRTRVVCFLHLASSVHFIDRVLNSLMMRYSDAVWADSEATLMARYQNKQNKPTEVISFVLSDSLTAPCRNLLAPRFVFWGRLHHQKGIDRAIEFIAEVVKSVSQTQFEIWGPDDGERAKLLAQVREKGLTDHVHFMGPADPARLGEIASGNAFYLQLSRAEGMAISVVEAMQLGLVPVVTPVGEIAKYCCSGKNAIIVEDPNNPTLAVNAVLELLQNEPEYRKYQSFAQTYWGEAHLYKDDICAAAAKLLASPPSH